jgi:fluoroquinolone resistance protein
MSEIKKAGIKSDFPPDPETHKIKKAMFSVTEIHGLLDKYDIEIDKNFLIKIKN